jgi:aryl-alcohol dehydrogenase-like predicted oxidoreductase
MEYRLFGSTGIRVSSLCLGTMTFGREADEATCRGLFKLARDAGVNFFDTADVYAQGRSEEILGRLVADSRDQLVIATKVRFRNRQDVNAQGLSRRHVKLSVEGSLKRLGTDRIDLYLAHGFDPDTPMVETLRALDDLVHEGKVLYLGLSNWAAWQVARALGVAAVHGLTPIHGLQPMYNLVKRQAEVELLPLASAEKLGVMVYSPLGGGLLSGKYGSSLRPEAGRLVESELYQKRYAEPGYYRTVDAFVEHAKQHGVHPASLAVAWTVSHPAVSCAILGARDPKQLEPALAATTLELSAQRRQQIAALGPEPPPATDRLEERSGVRYGRRGP